MKNKLIVFLLLAALLLTVLPGCGGRTTPPPPDNGNGNGNGQNGPGDDPLLDGATLVAQRCARCHNLERVEREYETDEWPAIVTRMEQKSPGLLSEQEYDVVVEYLQENFGK
jgi:hypothetical protein